MLVLKRFVQREICSNDVCNVRLEKERFPILYKYGNNFLKWTSLFHIVMDLERAKPTK